MATTANKPQQMALTPEDDTKIGRVKGHKRIMGLGEENVALVNSWLLQDTPVNKVAAKLRELGAFEGLTTKGGERAVERYKHEVVMPFKARQVAAMTTEPAIKKMAAVADKLEVKLDAVQQMEALCHLQVARVNKLSELEANLPGVLKDQSDNITRTGQLLKSFLDMQMELGLVVRAPKKMDIGFQPTPEQIDFAKNARLKSTESNLTFAILDALRDENVIDVQATDVTDEDS